MHNLLKELVKFGSMQGFCHVISDHLVCWTISDVNVAFGLLVSNVEVSDVQVMRVLASTLVTSGLKQHGTLVVLIEDILLDRILTEFCQPIQVQSHLEMPVILVQLGHIQRT